jgi:uncharacterized membrane protein YsdA (DUF1294 family)
MYFFGKFVTRNMVEISVKLHQTNVSTSEFILKTIQDVYGTTGNIVACVVHNHTTAHTNFITYQI